MCFRIDLLQYLALDVLILPFLQNPQRNLHFLCRCQEVSNVTTDQLPQDHRLKLSRTPHGHQKHQISKCSITETIEAVVLYQRSDLLLRKDRANVSTLMESDSYDELEKDFLVEFRVVLFFLQEEFDESV